MSDPNRRHRSVALAAPSWTLLAALVIAAVSGCGRSGTGEQESEPPEPRPQVAVPRSTLDSPQGKPPVVVISIDTLRSDRLPAYGYTDVDTPNIDRLRADSILFEHIFSPYPLTLPAHSSMLTGLLPPEHGVRDNSGYRLDASHLPFLPRLLQEHGYATGAAVSSYVLRATTGLSSGFDFYDDGVQFRSQAILGDVQRAGIETLDSARSWLRSVADEPFFFFFHIYEPHTPHAPPEPFASRYSSPYDGEVAVADFVVGELLEELADLGIYDPALILLTSDHGEGLDDHGDYEHGLLLYREAIQVPLMIKLPGGQRGGSTISEPGQLIDIFPTVVDLVGLESSDSPGRSLLRPVEGSEPTERSIYSETYFPRLHFGWSELRSLIEWPYHYIEGPDPELYDLVNDPKQKDNILLQDRRIFGRLRQQLATYDAA
ncbi:MAG: sulfatase, partial [Acidobacteriota bacterium]